MKRNEGVWWVGGFVLGLVIGLGLSLHYTWNLNPPPMDVTTPAALNQHDKEIYTVLVAAAYSADGDLDQAKKRLAGLEDPDIESTIVTLAEQYVKDDHDVRDVRALARLADGLGRSSAVVRPFLATLTSTATATPTETPLPPTATPLPPTATRTATPTATQTPKPSPSATRTPAPPTPTRTATATRTATPQPDLFRVVQSTVLCGEDQEGLLLIYVRDSEGEPVSGAQVMVDWPGGSDQFFTGFQSNVDPGYADFQMQPGELYRVELGNKKSETAEDVGGNSVDLCPDLSTDAQPSWQIVFQLP